jgi:hypothetical protein
MRTDAPSSTAAIFLAATLAWGGVANAADATHWATGKVLQTRLSEEVTILRVKNPLRRAIRQISQAHQVAILIDRRVDPDQMLDVSLRGGTLKSALQTIAQGLGLGVARLDNVVYLGPAPAAERLSTVATAAERDARRLPAAVRRKYIVPKRMAWDDLAAPRDLLAQLGRESGLKIDGLDKVPHDLWAAADLPPLSLVNRLTLIAIQFDLAPKIADGGKRLELVPLASE